MMKRTLLFLSPCILLVIAIIAVGCSPTQTPPLSLPLVDVAEIIGFPKPNYNAEQDDPEWLTKATHFHGHLGPAIIFGCRVGAAALDALGAKGYFDVEITAQGPFAEPPKSCVLDGLQLSTGATLGKRNLHVVVQDEYVITVKNRRTGVSVEIRPTPELVELMWSRLEPDHDDEEDDEDDDEHNDEMRRVEAVARQIANMPLNEMMTLKRIP
ncbi:MAG: formylmethanofuran dehydrogenase subunit E family protein [Planctomycetaceae bacterium]|nr:formylmethanofuran dehydrogenase subunit E family protein [Planctomycetaceae bacterium]